jgi:alkanesulfonate monooxygenase SsuD/methylene tetrahydromethanopterin reductase-like flavin-dependent oxidoreductase (luciferase family)
VLAKAVSTLDVLSGGRLTLTFGVSHAEHEFEALGVPFHRRPDHRQYLEAMIVLWTQDAPVYDGEFVRFEACRWEPQSRWAAYPPLWFGGNSPARCGASRYGTGWMPWLVPAEAPGRAPTLRDARVRRPRRGRDLVSGRPDANPGRGPLAHGRRTRERFSSEQEVIDVIGRLASWVSPRPASLTPAPPPPRCRAPRPAGLGSRVRHAALR